MYCTNSIKKYYRKKKILKKNYSEFNVSINTYREHLRLSIEGAKLLTNTQPV